MKTTTKQQLLAGTSALALVAAVSVSTPAFAAWAPTPSVGSVITTQQKDTGGTGDTLAVTNGGSINYTGPGDAVATDTGTGAVITVTEGTGNGAKGIVNTSTTNTGDAAIGTTDGANPSVATAGTITSITNTGGTISSKSTSATSGTINLSSTAVQNTTITNNAGSVITNAGATGGNTIYFNGGTGPGTLNVNNTSGTISAPTTGQTVINVGATKANIVNINNTAGGAITAATATDKAIQIASAGGVATIVQSGATSSITGTVVLGTNAGSTFAINGGTVTGAITLGDTGQVLTLGGGQVVGAINGTAANKGQVVIAAGSTAGAAGTTYTTQGNMSNLTSVTVNDGITLSTGTNTIAATAVVLGNGTAGSTLTLGTGMVTGTIDGATGHTGTGTVNFNGTGTSTVNGAIGGTTQLAAINIASGSTVDLSAHNSAMSAVETKIGSGSTLKVGTGQLTGAVDGASAGVGTLNFAGNQSTAGNIGATNSLAAINVTGTSAVSLLNNAKATTTTVGDGTLTASLTLNGAANAARTLTGNVVIANVGTFNQNVSGSGVSSVTGTVDGAASGVGTYALTNTGGTAGTFTMNNAIGGNHKLLAFTTADNITTNINNNITATTTTFGGGGSGAETQSAGIITTTGGTGTTVAAGNTFTQTGGSLAGNLTLGSTGTFVLNGGSGVSGTIDGVAANNGVFTVASAFKSAGIIGGTNKLATINVNNGGNLTLGAATSATTVNVAAGGTLNLDNSAADALTTTNLNDTGTGIINIGTKAHTGVTTLTTNTNTDVIAVNINDSTAANHSGSLTATTVTYTAAPKVFVDTSLATGYIKAGQTYNILVGTGADAAPTSITTNSQFVTFTRDAGFAADTLTLLSARTHTYASLADSDTNSSLGAVLEAQGIGGATGVMGTYLGYLDSTTTSAAFNNALKQATPQVNQAGIQAISTTGQSMDVVATRLNQLRAGIDDNSSGMSAGGAVKDKGVWLQGFGTAATQDQRDGVDGFNATVGGVAVGADTAISDTSRLGLSFSYANSSVDGNGNTISNTDIDSYQVNLYGSHNMGAWYTDGLLGAAYHNYNSTRNVTAVGLVANSDDYNGETYSARLGGGYRYVTSRGIDITPNASLTYDYNHVEGYTESGAGALDNTVGSDNTQALIGRIGADFGYNYNYNSMLIRPVVRAAYMYDFIGDQADTTSQFTGGGAVYRVQDASVARSSFDLGASLNVARTDNISFSADYDFVAKQDYTSHTGILRARYNF